MVSNVNGSSAMQQMQQMQQLRNGQGPHGQGGGNGMGKGMGQLMQSLSTDDQQSLQDSLKSMDESQRKDVVSQLKELDVANLSQDQLTSQIQDILNPQTQSDVVSATGSTFSTYA